ncbi:undecaprenyl-diphosphate phosphatase [Methanobrevibacter filiformis]|uniref:Undecaprenyl-diphosphatase n=1 Tax=Methanobrevibacter filiformis TaxID=55758 RepID=A0A162FN23_9EURY|nr:undecaprenyl-diphosphate phosphatase [Methanobrevibacter filiformis]KZX12500.1 undecaprenyl-diphosphatase [Methanobrevibacter filiformis]
MDVIQAIIVGIVQGLTEFLPISSSAHLVFVQHLLNVDHSISFDVLLHLGTLAAVFGYYIKDIIAMIKAFFLSLKDLFKGEFKKGIKEDSYKKLVWMVLIGTIPVGCIGVVFNDFVEATFQSLMIPGFFLLITGILLYASQRMNNGDITVENMGIKQTIYIGIGQALAIFPGLSRSGTTISTGLLAGLDKEFAAKFSFLLSIPAILGATVVQLTGIESGFGSNMLPYVAGFIAAAISGYLAISLLIRLIKEKSLDGFAYYCWIVGAFVLVYLIFF